MVRFLVGFGVVLVVSAVVDDLLAELDPLLRLELGHMVGLPTELGVLPLQPVHLH